MAILALAAVGLNLALGFGGLVSFGHAAFFGIGGYAAGILASHAFNAEPLLTWPFDFSGTDQMPVIWLVAALVCGLVALPIGAISLRTGGVYFIMITLAFAQMIYYFAISWPAYGGEDGLSITSRNGFPGLNTTDPVSFFLICYALLLLALALMWRIARLRASGSALQAARQNEVARRRDRHRAVPHPPRRLRALRHDHRPRRRALRRPQPLRQPVDAVLADVGRTDRARHPRRHRPPVRPGRRRDALRAARIRARRAHRTLAALPRFHPARRRAVRARRHHRPRRRTRAPWLSRSSTSASSRKSFGALKATDDVSLDLRPGEIHALIGPNGAGKSTLIHQICGTLKPDAGSIHFLGQDIAGLGVAARARLGLGRTFQISSLAPEFSALRNVMLAVQARQGSSFRFFRPVMADRAADRAGDGGACSRRPAGPRRRCAAAELSHGERRQLEIAIALALRPKAFLLDEPMAGMGAGGLEGADRLLDSAAPEAPILLVEHDMDAVFALADRISVLVYGRIIASGTVAEIRSDPGVRARPISERPHDAAPGRRPSKPSTAPSQALFGVDLDDRRGRGRGPDGPQRHGQDDDDPLHLRPDPAARRRRSPSPASTSAAAIRTASPGSASAWSPKAGAASPI